MSVSGVILDGKQIAKKRAEALTRSIEEVCADGQTMTVATIQVGSSSDAQLYSASIGKLLARFNIRHMRSESPGNVSEGALYDTIAQLSSDPNVTGILIFAPLPAHLRPYYLLDALDSYKDIEGRKATLNNRDNRIVSPTANAVLALIDETDLSLEGKEAVIVGHSDLVGRPVATLLLDRMATVTVCHAKTQDLRAHVSRADIVVAAAGRAELIRGDWIKPGAVVIDVGENVVKGKLVGDVEFAAAAQRAAFISPVPGGVGPLTNVMLIENLLKLKKWQMVKSDVSHWFEERHDGAV